MNRSIYYSGDNSCANIMKTSWKNTPKFKQILTELKDSGDKSITFSIYLA